MSKRNEQLLFRYSSALERGEFETVAEVLREAERDPALEQAILEMNEVYAAERVGSSNHSNHTNPREVPMTVALYGRRSPAPLQWQSLPLVAALAVIAVLTLMLAAQIRSNAVLNTGQGDMNGAPALAQISALCETRLVEASDAHTRADETSVVVGTIPAGTGVKVLEAGIQMRDESEAQNWALWVFVVAEGAGGVQGWIPSTALDRSDCPQATFAQASATPTVFSIASEALPTFTPTAAVWQVMPTFTLTPFVLGDAGTLPGTQCTDSTESTPLFTLYARPATDSQVVYQVFGAAGAFDPRTLVLMDSTEVNGQGWYYMQVGAGLDQQVGWLSAEQYRVLVSCASAGVVSSGDTVTVTSTPLRQVPPTFTLVPADVSPMQPTFTMVPANADGWFIGDGIAQFTFPSRCEATLRAPADVMSEPSWDAQVLMSLPRGTEVEVSAYAISVDARGRQEDWYFGAFHDGTGWLLASLLDASACPAVSPFTSVEAGTPQPFTVAPVEFATVVPVEVQPIPPDLSVSTALPPTVVPPVALTFTPSPMPFTLQQATTAPEMHVITLPLTPISASAGTSQYDTYVVQSGDTLESILQRSQLDSRLIPQFLSINQLFAANPVLTVGRTLYLPIDESSTEATNCYFHTTQVTDFRRSGDILAPVIGTISAGVNLQLLTYSAEQDGLWVEVSAQDHGTTVSHVWVSGDDLHTALECPTPEFTVSAVPVDTPLQLQPTVVPVGTLPAQPTPQYYVYVVQPGDTLLSILTRFGLGESALSDVLRANNLSEDSVIAPGITLYVPTSQQLITLACRINAARTVDLRVRPEADAPVIGMLPVGAAFELIDRSQQTDGVWYAVSAQVEGVTVSGAWVSPGTITVPTDCQQSVPGTVITVLPADVSSLVPTVLPQTAILLGAGEAIPSCVFEMTNAVTLYDAPSAAARAIEIVHTGTPLEIWMLSDLWYSVLERHPDGLGNQGYVRADALTLPDDCHLTPAMAGAAAVTPTPTPALILPTPTLVQ